MLKVNENLPQLIIPEDIYDLDTFSLQEQLKNIKI